MAQAQPSLTIPSLTGIRAIAAFLVFFHHYQFFKFRLLNEFHIGVSIFFVLSGFLIYYRYYESSTLSGAWWKTYIINRAARIYPMYFLLTCATFVVEYVQKSTFNAPVFFLNITFLHGFFKDYGGFTGIPQGWTLTVEECFYFLAPLIFTIQRKGKFWLPILGIYAVGLVFLYIGRVLLAGTPGGFCASFEFVAIYTFFGRCFEFFVGMFAARLVLQSRKRSNTVGKSRARELKLPNGTATWCGIVGMSIIVSCMSIFQDYPHWISLFHTAGLALNNLVLPLFIGILLWGLAREVTPVSRFLGSKPMLVLGKSSYLFYLLHLGPLAGLLQILTTDQTSVMYVVLVLFITVIAVSIALFYFVEDPLNRILRKLLGGTPQT